MKINGILYIFLLIMTQHLIYNKFAEGHMLVYILLSLLFALLSSFIISFHYKIKGHIYLLFIYLLPPK